MSRTISLLKISTKIQITPQRPLGPQGTFRATNVMKTIELSVSYSAIVTSHNFFQDPSEPWLSPMSIVVLSTLVAATVALQVAAVVVIAKGAFRKGRIYQLQELGLRMAPADERSSAGLAQHQDRQPEAMICVTIQSYGEGDQDFESRC